MRLVRLLHTTDLLAGGSPGRAVAASRSKIAWTFGSAGIPLAATGPRAGRVPLRRVAQLAGRLIVAIAAGMAWLPSLSPAQVTAAQYSDEDCADVAGFEDTEAALERFIDELQSGSPDYCIMEPELAELVEAQLPRISQMFRYIGRLDEIQARGTRQGADVYRVLFTRAQMIWYITLSPAGRISGAYWNVTGQR